MNLDQLNEEPNTSLMYHKLFPNSRLLRELESKGYKFSIGSGLKLHRQYYASQHRNQSGLKQQRTIQSLVITKNGKFFRKIPKAMWVQLIDPSDAESLTYGEVFMKKLLKHEMDRFERKKQHILSQRS